MNITKRTWILFGLTILLLLAAFASLYFEKEEEIKILEEIEPERPVRKVKVKEEVKTEAEEVINQTSQNNGDETTE